jgi:tetratricopeptide (TPR) repeat protein
MLDFRYRAFLCYSHRDSAWADWLHRALESYPIPSRLIGLTTSAGVIPARLAPVFRDRDELPSATDLSAKVSDALAQSACLIVICSPHSAQSHWVNEEVEEFQRLGRAHRIFCLIVDGEPGASAWTGREHDECLPAALMHRIDASGNATVEILEPIAADVRADKDGKANARSKLVAGILGVDLDDLRHRERRRRRWRLAGGIAAWFALLCLTTALAVNAVIARHAAERRQKQAEDLVGFMLGDLDDKLRQVNRLDILESVADKTVKYFDSLPLADMTDEASAQRAKALLKVGAVRRDLGRVAEAIDSFKLAADSSSRLVQRAPDNVDYLAINAESQTWLGFVDWSQGHLADALARFVSARDLLERARVRRPADVNLLEQIAITHTNAGRVFEAREQMADARREYFAVIEGYEVLARLEPDKLDWKAELGYAHGNLGQLALKEGRLEEAISERIVDQRVKSSLAAVDPTNNIRREDLAAADAMLGDILLACGDIGDAAAHMRAALDAAEALLAIDSSSTDWLEKAGDYSWKLGQIERAQGNFGAAARLTEIGVSRLRALSGKDPGSVVWQRKLAQALAEQARTLLAQQRTTAARQSGDAAARLVNDSMKTGDEDRAATLLAAQMRLLEGDVAAANRDPEGAKEAWHRVGDARQPAGVSREPAALDVQASALLRLGRSEDAAALVEQLARIGYARPDFIASVRAANLDYPDNIEIRERIERALAAHPRLEPPEALQESAAKL